MLIMQNTIRKLAVLVAAAGSFVACGDDGGAAVLSGGDSSSSAATKDALVNTVKVNAERFYTGDFKSAYGTYSKACQADVSLKDFLTKMAVANGMFEGMMGVKLTDLRVDEVTVSDFTSSKATVVVATKLKDGTKFDAGAGDPSVWVYEDGGWRSTDCAN